MSKNIEYISDNFAIAGDIIINMSTPDPAVAPDAPRPKETGTDVFAPWGESNDFPQQVIKLVEEDTELPALLDWKSRLLQGNGVKAYQEVWDDAKEDFVMRRINDEEINGFLNDISWQRYWREACTDYTWFKNIFPDLIKSKGGDKIATISCHHAAWTRLGKMDNTGTVIKAFVSANWPEAKVGDEYTKEYPVVDPYSSSVVDSTKGKKAMKRFIYPVSSPSPGKAYYSLAAWISFIFSDWYEIKNMIPKWKLKFMKRILSAAKIVNIPLSYWPAAYKDWETLDHEQRQALKKAKVAEIAKSLTGLEGVGATILSESGTEPNGNQIPMLKVESIESGFTDGQHLEDSQEASQHLMRSLGVDPTLVGNGPGRGKDAGSGSDKRIAMNIATALLTPDRAVIIEPLVFKAKYDGWFDKYPNLRFIVQEVNLGTLDEGPTSKLSNPVTPATSKPTENATT